MSLIEYSEGKVDVSSSSLIIISAMFLLLRLYIFARICNILMVKMPLHQINQRCKSTFGDTLANVIRE